MASKDQHTVTQTTQVQLQVLVTPAHLHTTERRRKRVIQNRTEQRRW